MDEPIIFTVGHSNRSIGEFIELLTAHGIQQVADIRTIPKSAHNPQFGKELLAASLKEAGIGYVHLQVLGGLRHAKKDSVNLGWRNASFRGYADYMSTKEFAEGLAHLTEIARTRRTAIMCAESLPWRCHRSLVADALMIQNWRVEDIMSAGAARPHKLTPFLRVEAGRLTYPEPEPEIR